MANYVVGPGVAAAMAANGDVPRSDEVYDAHGNSRTLGRDAEYVYIKEDNRTNRLPFEETT